jgi:hypothetical protein
VQKVVGNAIGAGGKASFTVLEPKVVPAIPLKKKVNLKKIKQPKVVKVTSKSSPLLDMKAKRSGMVKSVQAVKSTAVFDLEQDKAAILDLDPPAETATSEIEDKSTNIMVY